MSCPILKYNGGTGVRWTSPFQKREKEEIRERKKGEKEGSPKPSKANTVRS